MADDGKTKVVILTHSYRIKGSVHLLPGARITDFLVDSKEFLAVTDVEIWNLSGQQILSAPFVSISREHIEIVTPE